MRNPRTQECMSVRVATCGPRTDLEQAAHLMWTNDCGVIPVVDEAGRVVGVLTDRDLAMGAYTQGRALRELRVADSMSRDVVTCTPQTPLEDVLRTLGERQVHRVPVVDEQGILRGILSLDDIVRRVQAMDESPTRSRLEAGILRALAAICAPRRELSTP
jgi:CBS domain-containing protein